MLNALVSDSWVERIHLTPTHINPLKNLSTNVGALGDSSQRKKWLDLWLQEVGRIYDAEQLQKVELNLAELEAGRSHPDEPSFTVDSLRTLLQEREASFSTTNDKSQRLSRWALALGSDSLQHLEKWKDVRSLLALLDGVWIFRRGQESNPLARVPESFRALCEWRLMGQAVHDVSSTDLRRRLALGESVSEESLVPNLRDALK